MGRLTASDITRRSIIGAAPVAGLATLMIGTTKVEATPQHDPLPGWLEEWKLKSQIWEDAIDGPEEQAAFKERIALERLICTTQPTSLAGAAAQLEYAIDDFGPYITGNIWQELDAKLFANLLAGLKAGVV